MKKTLRTLAVTATLALPMFMVQGVEAKQPVGGAYLPGDFHQHSYYTDGSNPFFLVMEQNANHGLAWWANSEHGGSRNRDGNGKYWDDVTVYPVNPIDPAGWYALSGGHQVMWRWQGLRDFVYPDILATRANYPDKTVLNGYEWNVPGHEHCSTAIVGEDAGAISAFEFMFDGSDVDMSREGEATPFGTLVKQNGRTNFVQNATSVGSTAKTPPEQHADSVAGVAWMQEQLSEDRIDEGYIVFAHIERDNVWTPTSGGGYNIEHFRDYNNAGPEVAFGYEGAPGHQTQADRGFERTATGGGTYGGSGWYSAQVGGLWDALLGEGRNWWNFASSDFHAHWSVGGSDFWPGEYQKNYTFIDTGKTDREAAVVQGLRSGNSWHVMGDLIDDLQFTAKSKNNSAVMGQTMTVAEGDMVTIKIRVHDPETPNQCPLDMDNPSLAQIGISQPLSMPELHHVDLIAGEVAGIVEPSDPAYTVAVNPTAAVVETFERTDCDEDGYMTFVYHVKAEKDMYFRLRGTNLPAGVPLETDENGNPLPDTEANDNLYAAMDPAALQANLFEGIAIGTTSKLDEVAEAYADLWFYSNPIYIKVVAGKDLPGKKVGHEKNSR